MHLLTCSHFERKTNPVGSRWKFLVNKIYSFTASVTYETQTTKPPQLQWSRSLSDRSSPSPSRRNTRPSLPCCAQHERLAVRRKWPHNSRRLTGPRGLGTPTCFGLASHRDDFRQGESFHPSPIMLKIRMISFFCPKNQRDWTDSIMRTEARFPDHCIYDSFI